MSNPDTMDVLQKAGKKVVLLGNEAVVRGALEAGMGFSASYPGTPSSEIGITLAAIADKAGFYCEWSTNEKTAFEACVGAAYCGVRALTAMKHFGMNVALDSILPVVYTGVKGGLVLVIADDPGGFSSAQSEQDVRYALRMGNLPTIEPSNAQECIEFTKLAFEISEKYETPVVLRTTTFVNHCLGSVKLGAMKKPRTQGRFEKNYERYYNIRPAIQKMHRAVLERLERIEKECAGKLNRVEGSAGGKKKVGIVAGGVCYEHVKELGLKDVKIAKIGMSYPISREFVVKFLKGLDEAIVVEELEPIIENFVKQVAKDVNLGLKVHGKDILPRVGEFSPDLIYERIAPVLGLKKKDWKEQEKLLAGIKIPPRKPVLCQGCPHRSTFYAVKKTLGENFVWAGDIGCYILGIYEPFKMQDFVISMGAGAGIAHGICKVSGQKPVVFMGDGTFFHAGMPAIANLVYNDSRPLLVIMDNGITAMTGHQPHAGMGKRAGGKDAPSIKIEEVLKGFGIKNIAIVNSFNQKQVQETVKEFAKKDELAVIISRGGCRLLAKREARRSGKDFPVFEIDQAKCTKCGECVMHFACPAILKKDNGTFMINPDLCWGCSVCGQICPARAIRAKVKTV
ncbi:Indolepyruvate oxidoreductase subunit IorA [Candidatus Gugararchaeum adminiculabundum]|nr:Indolepyruvate oxidoreductase subunit IorA [Candidatus Gugararchaeum adminiculabundum]